MDHEDTEGGKANQKKRTRDTIAQDIAKFLEAGGKIQHIETLAKSNRNAQDVTSSSHSLEQEPDESDSNEDYEHEDSYED